MKKIFSYAMVLLGGTLAFTACSDDNESNPTLVQPQEFSLFQPAIGNGTVVLEKTEAVTLNWTIPVFTDFGAPVVPTYVVQMSPTGSFTKEFDSNADDNTGADFVTIDQTFNGTGGAVTTARINQSLQKMLGWESEDDVPADMTLTFRAKSFIRDAGGNDYNAIISSNTVTIKAVPYFILDQLPLLWYMVGNNIGANGWGNDKLGGGLIPLLPSSNETYDKTTGTGIISYTGFFPAGTQFKFVQTPGDWNTQMNYTNVENPDGSFLSDEDGDNHNIGINAAGYYTVKMNTKSSKVTVEKYDRTVKAFSSMGMPGSYNEWNIAANPMTPCETLNGENHIWIAKFEPEADGDVKFAADGDWADNWGAEAFPWGNGANNGPNIHFTKGSYTVVLNDITGQYFFMDNAE